MKGPIFWLIWDGAASSVTRRLLDEGRLPTLARLARGGVSAATRPTFPNCQTPPSLATLLTGVSPTKHGITGFHIPATGFDSPVTARRSAFDRTALHASPLWNDATEAGRPTAVVHLPWTEVGETGPTYAAEAFSRRIARAGAIPIDNRVTIGPYELTLEIDDGSLTITPPVGPPSTLRGEDVRRSIAVQFDRGIGGVLRAWRRPADGARFLLSHGAWEVRTSPVDGLAALEEAAGPFVGDGLGRLYRHGVFGPRLDQDGDGDAEAILLVGIEALADHFRKASAHALGRVGREAFSVLYQPCIDAVEHELFGWCEPYAPGLSDRAWAGVELVYRMADRHLADVLARAGPDATVIVASDHGMAGIRWNVHVNEILRRGGLLAFGPDGGIDLARSQIVYHPANNGSLWVNTKPRPEGIVEPEECPGVIARAAPLLRGVRLTPDGPEVFTKIYPLDEPPCAWSETFGDLFLATLDGVHLRASPGPDGAILAPAHKSAAHLTHSAQSSLHGIFFAQGPGFTPGRDLGLIELEEVAPLVRHCLHPSRPGHFTCQT
jgi:predicted AlkP superfamily phosphohydrolase/phosphomutase